MLPFPEVTAVSAKQITLFYFYIIINLINTEESLILTYGLFNNISFVVCMPRRAVKSGQELVVQFYSVRQLSLVQRVARTPNSS